MVFMPPGSAKSTYATVKFPAYVMGQWEGDGVTGQGVITGSYGQDLANNFGRRVRNTVRSAEYFNLFPKTVLSQDSKAKANGRQAKKIYISRSVLVQVLQGVEVT